MLDDDAAALLQRLREETERGRLVWVEDADGYFVARYGPEEHRILIRRMFIEATNQIGADPYFVELSMPFWNARFTITDDSDGWRAVKGILNAAFPGGWEDGAAQALRHLIVNMPTRPDA
jgi:hypothetical protein